MHVLILSSAFGARGCGRSAFELARALARLGIRVTAVTPGESGPGELDVRGMHVVWVGDHPPMIPAWDLLPWTLQMNSGLLAAVATLDPVPDVVHAIGWDVTWAATAARALHGLPLVATVPDITLHPATPEAHKGVVARAREWLARDAQEVIPAMPRWGRRGRARKAISVYERAVATARTARAREPHQATEDAAAEPA